MNETSREFQIAIERFHAGDKLGAENLLRQAAGDAKFLQGSQSPQYAQLSYELASLLRVMGRLPEAIEAMREASSVNILDDHKVTKSRLTYLSDLGAMLGEVGDIAAANQILRQALKLRGDFYGQDHSGYAFGLEPLAILTMNAGHLPEALKMIEHTISIFWKDGHPRIATAFPCRAMILKRMKQQSSAFAGLEDVPDEIMHDLVHQIDHAIDQKYPAESQAVVFDLLQVLRHRYGEGHELTMRASIVFANVQRWGGPSEGRIESLEKIARQCIKQEKLPDAVEALLGLAEAHSELKDLEATERAYKHAYKFANDAQSADLQTKVLRNFGLFYSESNLKQKAEKALRLAATVAQKAEDAEQLGKSLLALGIFLQHGNQLEEAERLLQRGLQLVDSSGFDFVCASSHLQAIQKGDSCGCGDQQAAFRNALRNHLMQSLPSHLVNDVQVEAGENGFEVQLDYHHDLNDLEQNELRRAMEQANIDFHKKMKRES